jgi:putative heme-binding domain-containing protein
MLKKNFASAALAAAVLGVLPTALADEATKKDRIVVEALMRLDGVDVNADAKLAACVKRYLAAISNDPAQLKIISKLKVQGMADHLMDRAMAWGATTHAVQALDLAIEQGGLEKLKTKLMSDAGDESATALSRVMSLSNRKDVIELHKLLIQTPSVAKSVKVESAVALSRNKATQSLLIDLAKQQLIPAEAHILIGATLRSSENESVRSDAAQLFPPSKSNLPPLPPVEQLVKRSGNVANGKTLYHGVATCGQCHVVGNEGKNVGPNLSEIGDKLSRDAMYVAIIAPSAGISHNYESYAVRTDEDETIVGLLVSNTDAGVTIKDSKGIERTIPKASVAEMKKQEKSLMPENLHELTNEQGLIDVVEYLTTLKKSGS